MLRSNLRLPLAALGLTVLVACRQGSPPQIADPGDQVAVVGQTFTLAVLATAPVPLSGLALAKALAHWLTTGVPLTFAAPVLGYLLGLPAAGYGWLVVSLFAGTLSLSVIGTFGAALTIGVRRGGLLLSLLVLPLYIPTLIFGAQCVTRATQGGNALASGLLLLGITFISLAVVPPATGAALRAGLR